MTGQSTPVRVVVADDQRVVRDGLVTVLGVLPGIEVVGAAADGEQALALVKAHRPQVVLMDLRMPRLDGVEATRRILAAHPATAVVVLTTYATAAPAAAPGDVLPSRPLPDRLTAREAEVLALIATGRTNSQIAKVLVVSPSTVKTHINNIFAKTGISDRAHAVRYAYEHGLADPGSTLWRVPSTAGVTRGRGRRARSAPAAHCRAR